MARIYGGELAFRQRSYATLPANSPRKLERMQLLSAGHPYGIVRCKVYAGHFGAEVDGLKARSFSRLRRKAEKILVIQHRLQLVEIRADTYGAVEAQIECRAPGRVGEPCRVEPGA